MNLLGDDSVQIVIEIDPELLEKLQVNCQHDRLGLRRVVLRHDQEGIEVSVSGDNGLDVDNDEHTYSEADLIEALVYASAKGELNRI